jgi:hypothetical protein
MRNHIKPKIKWADITHNLKNINNTMMPNTSTLTTEQQERCYDFFIKQVDFEINDNQNAHMNNELMKRIVKNSLLRISGNDQPWHNTNGYAISNHTLYDKHPHKRLGFLSQLQSWQDCFNQPEMLEYNYELFFCKNQNDFTLFFIATIEGLADKYQHITASLSSTEKK